MTDLSRLQVAYRGLSGLIRRIPISPTPLSGPLRPSLVTPAQLTCNSVSTVIFAQTLPSYPLLLHGLLLTYTSTFTPHVRNATRAITVASQASVTQEIRIRNWRGLHFLSSKKVGELPRFLSFTFLLSIPHTPLRFRLRGGRISRIVGEDVRRGYRQRRCAT